MIVNYDIVTHEWSVSDDDRETIAFSFTDDGGTEVEFNNLSFGISVFKDDKEIISESMPLENMTYVSTSGPYVHVFDGSAAATGRLSDFVFWAEESGHKSETLYSGILYPTRPHPSWQWDDILSEWIPPVSYPNDGKVYFWHEDSVSWQLVEEN